MERLELLQKRIEWHEEQIRAIRLEIAEIKLKEKQDVDNQTASRTNR